MLNKRVDGFLLIDKEEGWTSFDVCKKTKGICKTGKVGHSGTLDPFATGLLIVAVNEACKVLPFVSDEPKEYIATLSLGQKTDTGDKTGKIIEQKNIPSISKKQINELFDSLIGKQQQIPPMTSAVHVNGVKLYKLAHQGVEVERKPRNIEIFSLKLLKFKKNIITFSASVSSGTYVRTLGETIAEKLNTVGHLTSLRRTSINHISVKKAKKIKKTTVKNIKSINEILPLPKIVVDGKNLNLAINGNPIALDCTEETVLVIDPDNKPLGVYHQKDDKIFMCERGLNL